VEAVEVRGAQLSELDPAEARTEDGLYTRLQVPKRDRTTPESPADTSERSSLSRFSASRLPPRTTRLTLMWTRSRFVPTDLIQARWWAFPALPTTSPPASGRGGPLIDFFDERL